jgi:MFS transporter, ACS family, D-galactonate transporter
MVGPLVLVAALLALIPVVPARVCDIEHQYIGTATGLMLTLAAVGGFFIPVIFGHLVPHTSFDTGWLFLALVSFACALLGLAGRNPATAAQRPGAGAPTAGPELPGGLAA